MIINNICVDVPETPVAFATGVSGLYGVFVLAVVIIIVNAIMSISL